MQFLSIRRPCVAGYTACERLPSLHAFPPSLFLLCCLSRILFCSSLVSREGPGGELGRRIFSSPSRGGVVAESSTPPPCRRRLRSRLEAKQRLCSGLDATTSILGLPRYPLSALGHPFFVAFGDVFGNFLGRWFRDPIFASIWGSQSGPKSLLFGGAEVPEV